MIRKITIIFKIVFTKIFSCIFCILFRLKKNKVLFISDVRNVLDSNLKYVYDNLDGNKFEKVVDLKQDRAYHRSFSKYIKTIYDLTTSKHIILDDFVFYIGHIYLRKEQRVVQLWHALGAFKKFGYSRNDLKNIDKGYKKYTKVITSSENIRECYSEAFGVKIDKVKATGIPRTDMFFNKEYMKAKKEEIYANYPELKNKKVITFAPTYRGKSLRDAYYDFTKLDVDKIYNELKDDYIFIFKWHPAIYNNIKLGNIKGYDLEKYRGFFIDLSESRDINDLLLVTDILVTDYSSVIFDYLFVNKPIIYYTYDLSEYENERGLYYPFSDYVYGDITKNTQELIESIKKENLNIETRQAFRQKFMEACDGKSTEKTCKWIFGD